MKTPISSSFDLENLGISGDPRQYGPTSRSPLLTKKARALAVRASKTDIHEFRSLLREYLDNHEEDALREALAACPDQLSYSILFGFLAREASEWLTFNAQFEPDVHVLFGIPLTLHASIPAEAEGWQPAVWGAENNEKDLSALLRILEKHGIVQGMSDLTILPHLVDPAELANLDFTEMPQLAAGLLHRLGEVSTYRPLAHRPWKAYGNEAQCRVLVMAARVSSRMPVLEAENERCTIALNDWASKSFRVPTTLTAVASSPERLLPLLTGKGLRMFNCARLVHLLGHFPKGSRPVSPFVSMSIESPRPPEVALKFEKAGAACVWSVHGRSDWDEESAVLDALLDDSISAFARVRLGLSRRAR